MKPPTRTPRPSLSRRAFIKTTASVAAGLALSRALPHRATAAARNKLLPIPQKSGIEHVVVAMMENRSFDHLLGWLPGAEGRQAGLSYPDRNGALQPTKALAPDFQGCDHPDPDHSYAGG